MPPNVKPLNNHGRVCLLRVRGLCIQCVFICAFLDVLHTISIICIVSLSHCRTVARGKMPRMFRLMTFQRFFYINILTSECYILLYCGHIKHSWTSEMKIITAFTHHAMASKYRTRQKYVYKHCVCVWRALMKCLGCSENITENETKTLAAHKNIAMYAVARTCVIY